MELTVRSKNFQISTVVIKRKVLKNDVTMENGGRIVKSLS